MITNLESIKKTLNAKYKVFNVENNYSLDDSMIMEFSYNFLKENSFINGFGWGETNLTEKGTFLYVFKGMNFANRVAASGKAGFCPIISYCATTQKQWKLYGDIILDPTCSDNSNYIEILKIRNDEGVSHGMNVSNSIIIKNQEIITNIFISWADKKVNEKKFRDKKYNEIKKYLSLAENFIINKYEKVI